MPSVCAILFVNFGLYVLFLALFVAFYGIIVLIARPSVTEHPEHPLILEELEEAHDHGELSDEEFDAARAQIAAVIAKEHVRHEDRAA